MKKAIFPLLLTTLFCAFTPNKSPLRGIWEYRGGLFNGKQDTVSTSYKLQRTYDDLHYQAKVIEKGQKTFIYEKGDYRLQSDTCFETQIYCNQPSKLLGKTVKYSYKISNDTLKLLTTLPNGNKIEDHWVKVK
ncbi:hypothetical protein SAMN05421821_10424 [Mucilaginibacter lappiensis]|uniref:Lipocalin-like domain-containing protein n=1 Tax=Mucilaginibacter lappiensis TaxID=354630 RepID=A0ABR6PIH0_9SPHI|nr:hypothetical protein [Mucilaginibacter lappiensis]MBB6109563.1 hypothetical protein [Mucilaginibacter lappiensis]SIQ90536.1 hypothetical protein SAMN05421821_10424 [Mucilaginibacter lappiensis]